MMNKIIYLLIGLNSWCKLEEASPNLSTNDERSGFLPPQPIFLAPTPSLNPPLYLYCGISIHVFASWRNPFKHALGMCRVTHSLNKVIQ
jgi:hypothetical protein